MAGVALASLPPRHALFVYEKDTLEEIGRLDDSDETPFHIHQHLVLSFIKPLYRYRHIK